MYSVTQGSQAEQFEDRAAAIAAAKEWSRENHGTTQVVDAEEVELFVYRNGDLDSYMFETRRGRSVR